MKLYNLYEEVILEGLITEGVNTDQINNAINGEYANNGKKFIRRIKIHYDGDDVKDKFNNITRTGKGWRDIVVHALGYLEVGGKEAIRAYQVYGDSKRTPTNPEGWKLFRTDRITHWEPTNLKYWDYIDVSSTDENGKTINKTNIHGDGSMSRVTNIVNFDPKGSDPSDTINKDNMNIDPKADTYTYDNDDTGVVVPEPEQPETDVPTFDTDKEGVGFDDERIKSVLDTDIDSDYDEEDIDIEDDNDEIKDY